jgi:hypothetical protein
MGVRTPRSTFHCHAMHESRCGDRVPSLPHCGRGTRRDDESCNLLRAVDALNML